LQQALVVCIQLTVVDQEQWAKHFIVRLFEEDKHRIFTLVIYVPHKSILLDPTSRHYNLERSIFVDEKLNLAGFIENESLAEAGNMSVSGKRLSTASCKAWTK
jgi:hypothetical protein